MTTMIKAGQLLAITSGAYSDYCLLDHMRALRDFDVREEAERFRRDGPYRVALWDGGEPTESGSESRFVAWLIREHVLDPTAPDEVRELFVGGYSQLNPEVRPQSDEFRGER